MGCYFSIISQVLKCSSVRCYGDICIPARSHLAAMPQSLTCAETGSVSHGNITQEVMETTSQTPWAPVIPGRSEKELPEDMKVLQMQKPPSFPSTSRTPPCPRSVTGSQGGLRKLEFSVVVCAAEALKLP